MQRLLHSSDTSMGGFDSERGRSRNKKSSVAEQRSQSFEEGCSGYEPRIAARIGQGGGFNPRDGFGCVRAG